MPQELDKNALGQIREERSLRKLTVPSPLSKSTPGGQTGVLLFGCSPGEVERLQERSSLWCGFGRQSLLCHHRQVQNQGWLILMDLKTETKGDFPGRMDMRPRARQNDGCSVDIKNPCLPYLLSLIAR